MRSKRSGNGVASECKSSDEKNAELLSRFKGANAHPQTTASDMTDLTNRICYDLTAKPLGACGLRRNRWSAPDLKNLQGQLRSGGDVAEEDQEKDPLRRFRETIPNPAKNADRNNHSQPGPRLRRRVSAAGRVGMGMTQAAISALSSLQIGEGDDAAGANGNDASTLKSASNSSSVVLDDNFNLRNLLSASKDEEEGAEKSDCDDPLIF
uniref:Uncharacterized protein n=1 Tax=Pseudictyota dubia TaxID=2749911 RepID=A0A7R9ZHI7_9STRA|mmetsp:Transcript_50367/g.93092  ORF Transcript_50367/g.93092 Transcript_50367/m.93092 type:complete len:209 (+) Transcript_50367:2-628(+)